MDQIRVVFLGTSAGAPTRERNVACVAVVLDGRALLFDCGEGTQQQLLRGPIRLGAPPAPLEVSGPPGLAAYFEAVRRTSYFNPAFAVTIHELTDHPNEPRARDAAATSQNVVAPPTPAAIPAP